MVQLYFLSGILSNNKGIITTTDREAQNRKGNPGLRFARLLPRGGEIKDPGFVKVKANPSRYHLLVE